MSQRSVTRPGHIEDGLTESAFRPDDSARDQSAWPARRKRYCDRCRRGSEIPLCVPTCTGKSGGTKLRSFWIICFSTPRIFAGKRTLEIDHRERRFRRENAAFRDDFVALDHHRRHGRCLGQLHPAFDHRLGESRVRASIRPVAAKSNQARNLMRCRLTNRRRKGRVRSGWLALFAGQFQTGGRRV